MNWLPLSAKLVIFGLTINLTTILYIFLGIGGLSFVIYLLNLLFRKAKKRKEINLNNPEYISRFDFEKDKENLDNEIISVLKHRKGKER